MCGGKTHGWWIYLFAIIVQTATLSIYIGNQRVLIDVQTLRSIIVGNKNAGIIIVLPRTVVSLAHMLVHAAVAFRFVLQTSQLVDNYILCQFPFCNSV